MKLGYVGLGKMGGSMVARLVEQGHEVVAYDVSADLRAQAREGGAQVVESLTGLVAELTAPRVVWLMVPHQAVDEVLSELLPLLAQGDAVIDGGNSFYKETLAHAERCRAAGVGFMDVGTSGGPSGARQGACLMIGGEAELFARHEPLFKSIAADNAYAHVGEVGAGHFVKMVHNGVEYGMMQSIAEGAELLQAAPFALNLNVVFSIYNNRSVIESRLVGWMLDGLKKFGTELTGVTSTVGATGEGAWAAETAEALGVPVPALRSALVFRKESAARPSYTGRALSAMRAMFGGHSVGT